jgi:hypothetical protein
VVAGYEELSTAGCQGKWLFLNKNELLVLYHNDAQLVRPVPPGTLLAEWANSEGRGSMVKR